MPDYARDFENFNGKIWLNAASEGPLPKAAAQALQEAIRWKSLPYELDIAKFASVPRALKESLGKLLNTEARDVILGNSASYGVHLLANGIPWQKGDEILLMQNDFPTNILPWLALRNKGVRVKQIPPREYVLTGDEILKNISRKTKLVCLSHVHTFSGWTIDVEGIADILRQKKIIFVLNISQSAGNQPTDVTRWGVDAVVCAGYKWLCGPYGTGFCWMKPELRDRLALNQAYWISLLSEEELQSEGPLKFKELKTARKYDVFGTANFFNFVPLRAAVDYWLNLGLENVRAHNQALVGHFLQTLNRGQYRLISPESGDRRSSLVVFSHKDPRRNPEIFRKCLARGIYPALWKGNIRVSPHVYNTKEEMERFLEILEGR